VQLLYMHIITIV